MISDRKFLWCTWFIRIVMSFVTLGSLFLVYVRTFVEPDIFESCVAGINALIGGSIFFSTFPGLRIHVRVNQLKKQLSEKSDFNHTLTEGASKENSFERSIVIIVTSVITIAFIIFNIVLGRIAYLNSDNFKLFLHMVVVIATVLLFNSIGLIFLVDENFKKLEGFISQLKKEQTTEEKSE